MSVFRRSPVAVAVALVCTSFAVQAQQPTGDAVMLDLVTVRSSSPEDASKNYTVRASRSATGLSLPLRKTPQSVSVITERQLEDQGIDTVAGAFRQAPGILQRTWGNGSSGYNSYLSRGYAVDTFRVDGMTRRSLGGTQNLNIVDSGIYESITLIRGATGLLTASGDPGGIIEFRRKRPTTERRLSLDAGIGSWEHYRASVDTSGALNADKSLRGRAVLIHDRGGEWQDRATQYRSTLYGIVEYDLTPRTLLSAGIQYSQARSRHSSMHAVETYYGSEETGYLPSPFGPHSNTSANSAYHDRKQTEVFAALEHQLDNGWMLEADYSYSVLDRKQLFGIGGTFNIGPDGSAVLVPGYWSFNPREHNIQLTLTGDYNLWGRAHQFHTGIGYEYVNDDDNPLSDWGEDIPIANIFAFDGNIAMPDSFPEEGRGGTRSKSASIFASTHLNLADATSLILGARLSNWDSSEKTIASDFEEVRQKESSIFTPYLGVIQDLNPWLSAYASYTTIFKPVDNKDVNEQTLDPEEGKSYELGLKGAWFENRLNASAAVFETRKDKLPVEDGTHADGRSYYRSEDNTKGRGWELMISGQLTPEWWIAGGYARTRIEGAQGQRLKTDIPLHLFSLSTTYDIDQRWTVGGRVHWQSRFWEEPRNTTDPVIIEAFTQKAYATFDLMARYRLNRHLSLKLNANNITDKHYKVAPSSHSYGAPRNFMASIRYDF